MISTNPCRLQSSQEITSGTNHLAPVWRLVLVLLILAGLSLAADVTVAAEAEGLRLDPAWLPGSMTPGIALQVRETDRHENRGTTEAMIELVIDGAPMDKTYNLQFWDTGMLVGGASPVMVSYGTPEPAEFQVDEEGNWTPRLPSLVVGDYVPGEWIEFRLLSTDGSVRALNTYYLFPIEAEQNGCKVWLRLLSGTGTAFAAYGEGFEPGETVEWNSISGDEEMTGAHTVEPDGTLYPVILLPAARGRNTEARYTATGTACQVSVEYNVGRR